MKPQTPHIALIIFIVVSFFGISKVTAQDCHNPLLLTPMYNAVHESWIRYSNVHVFVDNRFSATDRGMLIHGVQNWNQWAEADCSYVYFMGSKPWI